MKTQFRLWSIVLALSAGPGAVFAQGTAFTYQGRLTANGSPANGSYDLLFELYGDSAGANQVGGALTNYAAAVTNGLFTATLDFGPGTLPGSDRWLGIAVRTNGGGGFTQLRPVQKLTPVPYAVTAASAANLSGLLPATQLTGVVPTGLLAGTYGAAVSFTNGSNYFVGTGSRLTGVNAATLGGKSAAGFWSTTGNSGANPTAGNFLGTTDAQPLEVRVNGSRALRLEPASGSPNVIGGAVSNAVAAGVAGAVIAGGGYNYIDADSFNCAVGGGVTNIIQDSASESTIGGGNGNLIQTAAGDSTISGGEGNLIAGNATAATVGGGNANGVSAPSGTIGGGEFNNADGYAATVPGGAGNEAEGDYSFAAGCNAFATNDGAFVWADSAGYQFSSSANNEFSARATGGVRFVSAIDANGNPKAGVHLAAGGGSWASLSDRDSKENLAAVDTRQVLDRLAELPLATWNYKSQEPTVRHIGPMAQDFAQTFGVGEDQRHITTIDADGVALAAIQGLNRKLEANLAEKEAQIRELRQELAQLRQQVERLAKQGRAN